MFSLGALELIALVLVVLLALGHLRVPHRGRWMLVILAAAALAWLRPTFLVGWISPRTLATLSAGIVLGLLIFSRRAGGALAGILLLLLAAGLFWYLAVDRTPTTEPATAWRQDVDHWTHENISQPVQELVREIQVEIQSELQKELPGLPPLFSSTAADQVATRFELKFRQADLTAHHVTADELTTTLWSLIDQVAQAPSPDRADVPALEATVVAHRADAPLTLAKLADIVRSTRRDPRADQRNFVVQLQWDDTQTYQSLVQEMLLEVEHAQLEAPALERPVVTSCEPGRPCELRVLTDRWAAWNRGRTAAATLIAQATDALPAVAADTPPPADTAPPAVAAAPSPVAAETPTVSPTISPPVPPAAEAPETPAPPAEPSPPAAPETPAAAAPVPPIAPTPPVAPVPPAPPTEPGRRLNVRRSHASAHSPEDSEASPPPPAPARTELKRLTERPRWIDEPPPRTGRVFYLTGQEGPFATVEECEEMLPALAERLAQRYVQMLYRNAPDELANVDLSFAQLLSLGVVHEYYIEPVESPSLGRMHQLRLLTAFDDRTRTWIERRVFAHETQQRMITVGTGAALLCALLATVLGYLKLDTATRGYYSRRLQFGAAALMTAAVGLAVMVWTR